jgi:hypothetical protein
MKRKYYLWALLVVIIAIITAHFWKNRENSPIKAFEADATLRVTNLQATDTATSSPVLAEVTTSLPITNDQSPSMGVSKSEKWKWLREMIKKDRYFEYKAPISFYGKVVDDSGGPISGVSVGLEWTDANEATGASSRTVASDGNGLFSIEGVHGNGLSVNLAKQGYTKSLAQNCFSFNYGWFSDPYYHSPDSKNPVVFVMRKNKEAEPLIEYSEKRTEVQQEQSKQFTIGANGVTLVFERMTNDAPVKGGWISRVSVPNGGLQITTEEYPFEAPEEGYVDSITITNGTPKPPNWPSDSGAMMYFKTPQGYGRVLVRYISNMNRMFVTSWFNPNPVSRNLEVDPSKVQVFKP